MRYHNIFQKKQYLLLFSFLLVSLNAFNQVKNIGTPYLINYTVEDYRAPSKQNWMSVQDKRGVMYFANNTGVLEFDGQNWNVIPVTEKSGILRTLGIDSKGKIFAGGTGEFGYLSPDSIGKMVYVSLIDKIDKPENRKFKGVNRIFTIGNDVYFCGDDYIFKYSDNKVKSFRIEGSRQADEVNGRIFMRISNKGLYEWVNEKLKELPEAIKYKDISLRAVLPYGNDIMFVTMENGLLLYSNGKIKRLITSVDDFLEKNKIISAVKLADENYAFGMFSAGLLIIDKEGNVIQHVNMNVGLPSDLIVNIYQDADRNLWLCSANSINYVLQSLPLSTFNNNYELNSATYTSIKYNKQLYIGSSAGLFTRSWGNREKSLDKIEKFKQDGDPNNVWDLDTINNSLLVATNRGINEVKKNKIEKLVKDISAWKFLQVNGNPNLVIVGTNEGLRLLEYKTKKKYGKTEGKWVFKNKIRGFKEKCRHIEIDEQNNIWSADKSNGIIKLVPHNDFDSVSVVSYSNKIDTENVQNSYVFSINNKIIVGTDTKLFYYNNKTDKFEEYTLLNQLFGEGVKIWLLVEDQKGNIWYKQQRKVKHTNEDVFELGELVLQGDGSYLNYKTPFYKLKNNIYSITPLADGNLIIGTDKGFVHYDPNVDKKYSVPYNAMIRKVEFVTNDSLIFDGVFEDSAGNISMKQREDQIYKIPFQFNDIRFNFSSPFYDEPDQIQFKFFLENNDKGWSDWKTKSFKEYSNLSPGDYIFRVVAKNVYEIESQEATYYFTILPPWYQTIWARFGAAILLILLIWGIVRLSVRRLRKQKEHLEEIVKERTTEIRMKNVELEQSNEEIAAQRDEIEAQKDQLAETNEKLAEINGQLEATNDQLAVKNKNITASITYAKRIQEAMLPLRDKIQQNLDDYFILFKPRDIVSGDFYWFAQKNNKIIFTAVDCTGHGVPGAFMSMIGSEILTTIVNQGITIPSEILDYKNRYVRKALKQEQTENQDGMDMSLCTIDKQSKTVEWAGAKNPLVYIQNNELFHIKGDMQSIGGHQMSKDEKKFTNHVISYADATTYFYFFTDGFQDQFGGPKNRKFMIKKLKDIIFENYQKPMTEQEKILNLAIESWMKNVEQTDDILVIGFKLVP